LGNGPIGGEEALGVPWRLEPLHAPFPLTHGLVGIFGAIVQVSVLAVFHSRQHLPLRRTVARQPIRDDHPWNVLASFQEFAKEGLRRLLITPTLHEDIEDIPLLVYRPPQIVPLPSYREKHCIEVPRVPRSGPSAPQLIGIRLPKLPAPVTHRFIGQGDAACGHELFDIAVAETEAEIQPDAVTDDLCRKPMALIQVGWWWRLHMASMACRRESGQGGTLI
jgi:hypothetical protein